MGRPPTIDRVNLLGVARSVFTEKGFEATTLGEIAARLGVTAAALLRHAESKEALFAEAMRTGADLPPCVTRLEHVDAAGDQRPALRRFALEFIPYARNIIAVSVAVNMRRAAQRSLVFPLDTEEIRARRRRGVRILEGYFQRGIDAGSIRLPDARAAARLFVGSLQAYVIAQYVIGLPPYPLELYIDALIDLWTHGALAAPVGGKGARKKVERPEARHSRRRRDRGDRDRHLRRRKS